MQRLDDRSRMSGDVHVRFCESLRGRFPRATRHVCSFQYREDLDKFLGVIALRLGKFNLELSAEKTRVIKFTRFETKRSEAFTFLGFEYRWGLSRKNKPLVKMLTAKKKFRLALSAMQAWIKLERCKPGTAGIMKKLRAKFHQNTTSRNNRLLGLTLLLYEVSNNEEPCAKKPHAGICEGTAG